MDAYIHYSLLTLLELVFVYAVYHKVVDFDRYTGVVTNYRLFPYEWSVRLSQLIIVLELCGIGLTLFAQTRNAGLVVLMGLLAVYAVAMGINILRGRTSISCGCGGEPTRISVKLLVRNACFITMALICMATADSAGKTVGIAYAMLVGFVFWLMYLLIEKVWVLMDLNRGLSDEDLVQVKK